jgi:hypothetical protein
MATFIVCAIVLAITAYLIYLCFNMLVMIIVFVINIFKGKDNGPCCNNRWIDEYRQRNGL